MFQHNREKVKVTVAVRRKLFSLFWHPHFQTDFNISSHKCVMYKAIFVINIIIHMCLQHLILCEFKIVVFLFLRERVCSP